MVIPDYVDKYYCLYLTKVEWKSMEINLYLLLFDSD